MILLWGLLRTAQALSSAPGGARYTGNPLYPKSREARAEEKATRLAKRGEAGGKIWAQVCGSVVSEATFEDRRPRMRADWRLLYLVALQFAFKAWLVAPS